MTTMIMSTLEWAIRILNMMKMNWKIRDSSKEELMATMKTQMKTLAMFSEKLQKLSSIIKRQMPSKNHILDMKRKSISISLRLRQ